MDLATTPALDDLDAPTAPVPSRSPVLPVALRITSGGTTPWPASSVDADADGDADAALSGVPAASPAPIDPEPHALRLLRGPALDELVDAQRPMARHYAGHVIGLGPGDDTAALVERALDRAVETYRGWRRLRRRPVGLGARVREAIRVEAWRAQRGHTRRRT